MKKLSREESLQIVGGSATAWIVLAAIATATFLVGVWDGICRPLPCND